MRPTRIFLKLAAAVAITAGSAQAATISLTDFSFAPDGSGSTVFQATDASTANGGNVLPTVNGTVVYVVSTFTFGANSDAHLQWQFGSSTTARNRLGVEVQDTGLVQVIGMTDGYLQAVSATKKSNVNLSQDMAGQTITLVAKLYFNAAVSSDLDARNSNGGTATTADDTIMNVWINPDNLDVEGNTSSHASMLSNGDMYAVWNSASFVGFFQTIQNQSTPVTSGTSTIGDTTILTGANATFANAMALAIPEPSSALLGGLGLLALLRRRRNA